MNNVPIHIIKKKLAFYAETYEDRQHTLENLKWFVKKILHDSVFQGEDDYIAFLNNNQQFLETYSRKIDSTLDTIMQEQPRIIQALEKTKQILSTMNSKGIKTSYEDMRVNYNINDLHFDETIIYSYVLQSDYRDLMDTESLAVVVQGLDLIEHNRILYNFLFASSQKLGKQVKKIHKTIQDTLSKAENAEEIDDIATRQDLQEFYDRYEEFIESVQELKHELRPYNRGTLSVANIVENFAAQERAKSFLVNIYPRMIDMIQQLSFVSQYD